MIGVNRIDHFVLTVRSVEDSCRFYEQALGAERVEAPNRPTAMRFGRQKINLHEAGHEFEPKAARATETSSRSAATLSPEG